MNETKQYWKGIEQLANTPEFQEREAKEFNEYLPIRGGAESDEPSRRDFLKMMGFGVAAVSLAACEAPIRKAIPYVNKPVDVDPGVPNYYASTYTSGSDVASVVVKTREGRPIKIETNSLSPLGAGTTPQMEASVLSLYDEQRLKGPMAAGAEISWDEIDDKITSGLAASKKVALVSHTVSSPSTQATIDGLIARYPNVSHVSYDSVSMHGMLEAYKMATGKRAIPAHDFSKAKTIVSIGADFLGSWPNEGLNQKQFADSRRLSEDKKEMSRLYAFESLLTLTGANADYRTPIRASQEGLYVAYLYNLIAAKMGAPSISVASVKDKVNLEKAAKDLLASKGASIIVAGSNDPDVQDLVIAINDMLGSYGATIDLSTSVNTRQGDDKAMSVMVDDLKSGAVDGVVFYNCNPVYDHPIGEELGKAIGKSKLSVSTSDRMDETTALVNYVTPDHHYLESWNDFEQSTGSYSLSQPTIKNIFNTRQAQDSFLAWAANETNYFDTLQSAWSAMYAGATGFSSFQHFWDKTLQDGVFQASVAESAAVVISVDVNKSASSIAKDFTADNAGYELIIYKKAGVGDGSQANNPWLQEMPDPITKSCWDNYLTISPLDADGKFDYDPEKMNAQMTTLTVDGKSIEVAVLPQPGQAQGTLGLALGYGRTKAGKVADGVGVNAYPLLRNVKGRYDFARFSGVSITESSTGVYPIAQTQTTHTFNGRENVIQETTLGAYKKDSFAGNDKIEISSLSGKKHPYAVTLWKGHEYPNHHWGMSVDMNACNGCGACTVACQSENNVAVVGKQEVLNRREMHWIRIDRYFSHNAEDLTEGQKEASGLRTPEFAAATNPDVTFQPMMCQHCNNAGCETVCPVAATTHSTEGLNMMAYNRCVGTRYCANNCAYKVRRFNWFKYHDNEGFSDNLSQNNDLGKMVLNPDVTVRSRGVMEKCSFCVQRIQTGKLTAKREGRRPVDGEIKTACMSACSAGALVFGDMKDTESAISMQLDIKNEPKMVTAQEPRAYHVLEELRVMPNVWYMRKVRNIDEQKSEA
ncbi:MAG: TAT-variant-translocated molybdopterin oxidoreductase [Cytophagales bacterium]|nr:TAT-variant-translocated molybdopterin oxidoreductase [Cytophagales bacterium]